VVAFIHHACHDGGMSTTPDAVVVGAGVIGCGIALELARSGRSVLVVDRADAPGRGSTGASSAIVRYHYDHLPESALAWEAGLRWMEWERYLGVRDPTGMANFVRVGALVLEGPLMDCVTPLEHLRRLGIPFDELDAAAVRARFPLVDPAHLSPATTVDDEHFWAEPSGEIGGFWVPDAGYVDDPQLAASNLAHAAVTAGATFAYGTEVVEVTTAGGRVSGLDVRSRSGEVRHIATPVVVNAAGPWSVELNRLADVLADFNTSTRPLMQEVVSVPVPAGFGAAEGGTCVTDADFATYFRCHGQHSVIVGGMEPPCDPLVYLESADDAPTTVSAATWELQTLRLARRLRDVGIPSQPQGIVGVYDVTDDWIPIYDRTVLDGWYVAIGTSGHGFKQAPFVGDLLRALIDACEAGHDHDRDPVQVLAPWSGTTVDLGHFSRRRHVVPQYGMG
jgi:sarcosine oxidase subunit beta